MKKNEKSVITEEVIEIKGFLPRHEIVRKAVNTFIDTESQQRGKGVKFRYPVENLASVNKQLFIFRPGICCSNSLVIISISGSHLTPQR